MAVDDTLSREVPVSAQGTLQSACPPPAAARLFFVLFCTVFMLFLCYFVLCLCCFMLYFTVRLRSCSPPPCKMHHLNMQIHHFEYKNQHSTALKFVFAPAPRAYRVSSRDHIVSVFAPACTGVCVLGRGFKLTACDEGAGE